MSRPDPFKNVSPQSNNATNNVVSYRVILNGDNQLNAKALCIMCPYCGIEATYSLDKADNPHWELMNKYDDPITLMPSLTHAVERGGCGNSGWLSNGNFYTASDSKKTSPKIITGELQARLIE